MVTEYAYPVLGGVPEHVHNLSRELAARGHEVTVLTSLAPFGMKAPGPGPRRREPVGARLPDAPHGAVLMPFYGNGSVARVSIGMPGLKVRVTRALRGMDVVHAQGLLARHAPPLLAAHLPGPRERGHLPHLLRARPLGLPLLPRLREEHAGPHRPADRGLGALHHRDAALLHRAGLRDHPQRDRHRPLPAAGALRGPPRRPAPHPLRRPLRPAQRPGHDARRGPHPGRRGSRFVLQVVGDGPRPKYHHQAKALGVDDRVERAGLLDKERPRLYREATGFAAPCVLASFGVVLLEAMASGTPVVCADNIGFRQVILVYGAPGVLRAPAGCGGARPRHRRAARRSGGARRLGRAGPGAGGGAVRLAHDRAPGGGPLPRDHREEGDAFRGPPWASGSTSGAAPSSWPGTSPGRSWRASVCRGVLVRARARRRAGELGASGRRDGAQRGGAREDADHVAHVQHAHQRAALAHQQAAMLW